MVTLAAKQTITKFDKLTTAKQIFEKDLPKLLTFDLLDFGSASYHS